jgi:hypothetical protein
MITADLPVTYSPINADIYCLAYDGALSGMVSAARDTTSTSPVTFQPNALIAQAWAIAMDTAWNDATALDEVQAVMVLNGSSGFWGNAERNPVFGNGNVDPTDVALYEDYVDAIIAVISTVEENTYYYYGGSTPPPWRGGSGPITLVPQEVVYGSASDTIAQSPDFSWNETTKVLTLGQLTFTVSSTGAVTVITTPNSVNPLLIEGPASTSGSDAPGTAGLRGGTTTGVTGAHAADGFVEGGGANGTLSFGGDGVVYGGDAVGTATTGGNAVLSPGTGTILGSSLVEDSTGVAGLETNNVAGTTFNLIGGLTIGNPNLDDTLRFGVQGGAVAVPIPGSGTVDLSAAEYGRMTIVFTGTMTDDVNIVFPDVGGGWTKFLDFSQVDYTDGDLTVTAGTAPTVTLLVFGEGTPDSAVLWLSDDGTYLWGGNLGNALT